MAAPAAAVAPTVESESGEAAAPMPAGEGESVEAAAPTTAIRLVEPRGRSRIGPSCGTYRHVTANEGRPARTTSGVIGPGSGHHLVKAIGRGEPCQVRSISPVISSEVP